MHNYEYSFTQTCLLLRNVSHVSDVVYGPLVVDPNRAYVQDVEARLMRI